MEHYTLVVFTPDENESSYDVIYSCCFGPWIINNIPSESHWIVPGTLDCTK